MVDCVKFRRVGVEKEEHSYLKTEEEGTTREHWNRTTHRAIGQNGAAGNRPRAGHRGPQRAGTVCRAGAGTGAHPHLSHHSPSAVERTRGGARRRAGHGRAGALQPLPRSATTTHRYRRDDGPLRTAQAAKTPCTRANSRNHGPRGTDRNSASQEDQADAGKQPGRGHRSGAPFGAWPAQAGATQGGMACRGSRGIRGWRGAPHRAQSGAGEVGATRLSRDGRR